MSVWGQEETFVHRCLLPRAHGVAPRLPERSPRPAGPALPPLLHFQRNEESLRTERAKEALPRQSLSYATHGMAFSLEAWEVVAL